MNGAELRVLREALGLSREALSRELAASVGVGGAGVVVAAHTLYYWETGRRYGGVGSLGIPSLVSEWIRGRAGGRVGLPGGVPGAPGDP